MSFSNASRTRLILLKGFFVVLLTHLLGKGHTVWGGGLDDGWLIIRTKAMNEFSMLSIMFFSLLSVYLKFIFSIVILFGVASKKSFIQNLLNGNRHFHPCHIFWRRRLRLESFTNDHNHWDPVTQWPEHNSYTFLDSSYWSNGWDPT